MMGNKIKLESTVYVKKEVRPDITSQIPKTLSPRVKDGKKVTNCRNTIDKLVQKKKKSTVIYFPKQLNFDLEQETNEVVNKPVTPWTHKSMVKFLELLPRQVKQTTTNGIEGCGPQLTLNFKYMKIGRLIELANYTFGFHGWRTGLAKPAEVVHYEVKYKTGAPSPGPKTYTDNYFERLDNLIKYEEEIDNIMAYYDNKHVLENKELNTRAVNTGDDIVYPNGSSSSGHQDSANAKTTLAISNSDAHDCGDLNSAVQTEPKKQSYYTVSCAATIEISFRDTTVIHGEGISMIVDMPNKAMAFNKAKKEAINNGIKNCFGQIPDYICRRVT